MKNDRLVNVTLTSPDPIKSTVRQLQDYIEKLKSQEDGYRRQSEDATTKLHVVLAQRYDLERLVSKLEAGYLD